MNGNSEYQNDLSFESKKTREEIAMEKLYLESERQVKTAEILVKRLNALDDVHVSGGPFHYLMRAGTYGEVYDEPPWKLPLGIDVARERSGLEANPMKCKYQERVLVNNWVEERRDRNYIKYNNKPKLSQYAYIYRSEYNRAFSKSMCNKGRDVLLKIKSFPLAAHPVHQPDLDVDVLRCSAPKPEICTFDEEVTKCRKEMETEKRYEKYAREISGDL